MRRVWSIALLTFSEGVRMKVVLVFLILLGLIEVCLLKWARGDGTLAGRLQTFLFYALMSLGFFLSLATVFFSCATLANEFTRRTLHLVTTKPVARFQILFGKWLGINLLNVLIIVIAGVGIYGGAYLIQSQEEEFLRDRYKVRDVVWSARNSAQPTPPLEQINEAAQAEVEQRLETGEIEPVQRRRALQETRRELAKGWMTLAPRSQRVYEFEDLTPPEREDTVIQVRYKAVGRPMPEDERIPIAWTFLDPERNAPLHEPMITRERSGQTHQFLVRAARVIKDGRAKLLVTNPSTYGAVIFEDDGSLEVLYKVSSFELNFVRALTIVLLRVMLLSGVGLFFATWASFPVAALGTSVMYFFCAWLQAFLEGIGANDEMLMPQHDPYGVLGPSVRAVLVPLLRVMFPDFSYYDGVPFVVDGEFVPNPVLAWALVRILLTGVAAVLLGWLVFSAREVASVSE